MINYINKATGVTLIALVVTIIVMLILAGISIGVLENNGIIDKAGKAKILSEVKDIQENVEVEKIKREENEEYITFGKLETVLGKKTDYDDVLAFEAGELVYTSKANELQKSCFIELGIQSQTEGCYWIVNQENIEKYKDIDGFVGGTLEEFRTLVNAGKFSYELACLGEDIKLSYNSTNQYTPIGTSNKKFTNTLDGKNHTISGIYINNENLDYQGLFGYSSGTIKNLGVSDSYIKGKNNIGMIVGRNDGGTIENCYNKCNVIGNNNISGIVGYSAGTNYIKKCYNIGNIEGNSYIAGIVGYGANTTNVLQSYNKGDINGTEKYIGGIIGAGGNSGSTCNIIGCYNIANVSR